MASALLNFCDITAGSFNFFIFQIYYYSPVTFSFILYLLFQPLDLPTDVFLMTDLFISHNIL